MREIFCALDVGSERIKALVFEQKKGSFSLLSKKEKESDGVKNGIVTNVEKLVLRLQPLFSEIREEFKKDLKGVILALNGPHLFSMFSQGTVSVSRADQVVSPEDAERAVEEAKKLNISQNKKILEFFPFGFQIDGEGEVKNPVGLKGIKLEVRGVAVGYFLPYFKNLQEAILRCDLEILDVFAGPLASALAISTKKEKELGCVFLDLGAQTTSLSVFENDNLVYLSVLPLGSERITREIAIEFKVDYEVAKRIRLECGSSKQKAKTKPEEIWVEDEVFKISPKKIAKIVEKKFSEIFSQVLKELKLIQKEKLPGGIILTGGESENSGVLKIAKRKFNLPVKKGIIEIDPSLPANFSTCAGLVKMFQEQPILKEKSFFQKIKKIFQDILP